MVDGRADGHEWITYRAPQFVTRLLPARTERIDMNRLDFVAPLLRLFAVLNMNQPDDVCKLSKWYGTV